MRKQRRTKVELEKDLKHALNLFEKDNKSINQISKELQLRENIISRYFIENNINTKKYIGNKIYSINDDFFNSKCDETKAYIIGILLADGHIAKHGRSYCISIALTESDKELLDKINCIISHDKPLYYIAPSQNRYSKNGQYKLSITNKKLFESLVSIGVKSQMEIPEYINEKYFNAFIRGIFDGDGCISMENRKDNKNTYKFISGHFNIMFNEKSLAEQVQEILVQQLDISKTKIVERTGNGNQTVYVIRWSGTNNLEKIREYLYKDATIYLKRKKEKFSQIKSSNCRPKYEYLGLLERN